MSIEPTVVQGSIVVGIWLSAPSYVFLAFFISSFVNPILYVIASADISRPSTVSTLTSIVLIDTVVFAINHAYVELINNTAANNRSNSETFKFDFFCFHFLHSFKFLFINIY